MCVADPRGRKNPWEFSYEHAFKCNGKKYRLRVSPLACFGGVTTRLNSDFLLDWHNVLEKPGVARPHMYLSVNRNAPFAIKLERMENWAQALTAYDSVMEKKCRKSFTSVELKHLLKVGGLPRPHRVELSTDSAGLKKLFKILGFPQRHFEDGPTWEKLVSCARSGQFVDEWVKLKKKK